MKTTAKFGTLSAALSLVLAAGCAHRTSQYSSYDQSYQTYSPNTRTYENAGPMYNNYSSSTVNKNYSYSPSSSENSTSITATTGNDQVLVTQIRQSLNNNPNLVEVVPNIQVSSQNGMIILNGTVPSERQKQAVETLVKSTAGVVNVNNQLQVNLSPTASKSADKSSRIYTDAAAAGAGSASDTAATESATDSSSVSAGSGPASSLSSTNRTSQSGPSQGLPPTSDRPDQEPRLYSTNNTGLSAGPQSSTSADRSTAVSAGIAASQSGTSQSPGGASQSGISGTQSGTVQSSSTNQGTSSDNSSKSSKDQSSVGSATGSSATNSRKSDNLSSAEQKDLSASADTGQKTAIYSNGPSASLTNDASHSSLYTSAGGAADASASSSNTVTQSGAENKGLSATGNAQTRRYSGANTNSSTTASAAAASTPNSFEANVQGASQADQAIGQKVISELRADTSLAALLPAIRVNIDNGKATLSGTVKSQEEKLKMETAVQKVTGITSVDDQLRVGATPGPVPLK